MDLGRGLASEYLRCALEVQALHESGLCIWDLFGTDLTLLEGSLNMDRKQHALSDSEQQPK